MNKTGNAGRPKGRRKTTKIEVAIEPEIKEEFMRLVSSEGMTASVKICHWIREYINDNKTGGDK